MNQTSPLGINLGVDHITSAYVTDANETIIVAEIKSSQRWHDFFLDTLYTKRSEQQQREYVKENDIPELVKTTLEEIRHASELKLGRSVEIFAISYPEHFKMVAYIEAVAYTALEVYPDIKVVSQVVPYLNCIRYAYGLDTLKSLGYPPDMDPDYVHALLLHFDYQREYLEVSIMDTFELYDMRERFFRIENFGGVANQASPDELTHLKSLIIDLVDQQIRDNHQCQTQPEDFRNVIFSGEADTSEFLKIRAVIPEVYEGFTERVLSSIDPFWVAASGAARLARSFSVEIPKETVNVQLLR